MLLISTFIDLISTCTIFKWRRCSKPRIISAASGMSLYMSIKANCYHENRTENRKGGWIQWYFSTNFPSSSTRFIHIYIGKTAWSAFLPFLLYNSFETQSFLNVIWLQCNCASAQFVIKYWIFDCFFNKSDLNLYSLYWVLFISFKYTFECIFKLILLI